MAEEQTITISLSLFNQLLTGYGDAVSLSKGFALLEAIKADVAKRTPTNVKPLESASDKQ